MIGLEIILLLLSLLQSLSASIPANTRPHPPTDVPAEHLPPLLTRVLPCLSSIFDRIQVAQITTHSYLHGAQPSRSSLFTEMSHRFEMMRASNYSATSGTTAGSAPSSGDSGGARATAVAATIAQPPAGVARQHNAHPFYRDIVRSSGDGNDDGPPEMSADAAAAVTGGFMAFGRPRDVVKSIERALHDMGAEVRGML